MIEWLNSILIQLLLVFAKITKLGHKLLAYLPWDIGEAASLGTR